MTLNFERYLNDLDVEFVELNLMEERSFNLVLNTH